MSENLPHRTPATAPVQLIAWEGDLPNSVRARFPDAAFHSYLDQHFIEAAPGLIIDLLLHLRDAEQFDMLIDLTAVDRPKEPARFEVIYILYSLPRNLRIRVKTRVAENGSPASAVNVYAGANWLEREVFDMFGIRFDGHPDLKRILLPEDWTGFPLRKETSITGMDNEWVQRNLGIESGQS
jgi:NADH-quinone oxidoreductase subunit C